MESFGIESRMISSGITKEDLKEIYEDLESPNGALRVLLVTPERLKSVALIRRLEKCYFWKRFKRLVVDEAHCCSQWGFDFRPDYCKIKEIREKFSEVPILALTATATSEVISDVTKLLKMGPQCLVLKSELDRPNIFYDFRLKPSDFSSAIKALAKHLTANHKNETGIIYCATRNNCEKVNSHLSAQNFLCGTYHSGLEEDARAAVFGDWVANRIKVVVATTAFGMGVNKRNTRFVVHFTIPHSIEAFYQESGRAGRDGAAATSLLLFHPMDVVRVIKITRRINPILKLLDFITSPCCRRGFLCDYFGRSEESPKCNKNCDNCKTRIFENGKNSGMAHFRNLKNSENLVFLNEMEVEKILRNSSRKKSMAFYSDSVEGVLRYFGGNKEFTLKKLLRAWMGSGKKAARRDKAEIRFLEKGELSEAEAEMVLIKMVQAGRLQLVLKHSAFQTNVYVVLPK